MRVSDFALRELLGASVSGELWEAVHVETCARVAVKLMWPERTVGVDVAGFLADAAAVARVAHPNLARVHGGGITDDGRLYLARELVGGESLAHRLARGRCTAAQVADTGQQLARALHAAKVPHRALKPTNIRYVHAAERATRERVVLVDIGLARLLPPASDLEALCALMQHMLGPPPRDTAGRHLERLLATLRTDTPDPRSFAEVASLLDLLVGTDRALADTLRAR